MVIIETLMSKKKPKIYDPTNLIKAIKKWPNPMCDKKHGYDIYLLDGRARSNQTRIEHIVEHGHNLKVRDLEQVPDGINNYFEYKKDHVYKDTYNYYLKRKGRDKGLIKVSIQIDGSDKTRAWIKTIYITYNLK